MKFITKKLQQVWGLIKKFPFTCYGLICVNLYLFLPPIEVYDHIISILLIMFITYPFLAMIHFIQTVTFYNKLSSILQIPHESLLYNLPLMIITLLLVIILDIFIRKKLIPLIKKIRKK
jgi:hypothetical protein